MNMAVKKLAFILLCTAFTTACATDSKESSLKAYQSGLASWYGERFHGRKTASGEIFDMHAMTAAHPQLPFGTWLHVESPSTGKSVLVRVNDRGPFARGRILDLSYAAALKLGIVQQGHAQVKIFLRRR